MQLFRNHYFTFTLGLLLAALLFAPSIVKITHAINGHEHLDCKAVGELHIHEVELDCDFHDFNISPQLPICLIKIAEPEIASNSTKLNSFYSYLSKYQKLHFALRGPPSAS